jgi:probable rRNA maturation factor
MSLYISYSEGVKKLKNIENIASQLVNQIKKEENIEKDAIFNIRFINNKEMIKLNQDYRNKDSNTNVLSFTNDDVSRKYSRIYGDIAINPSFIMNESRTLGINFNDRILHMITHGIYHILGFDHLNDKMAIEMESKEIKILKNFGINNPYLNESE